VYLRPANISKGKFYTWNQTTLNSITSRNSVLHPEQFILPASPSRPFLVVSSTILGPIIDAPFNSRFQHVNFTRIEFTPLYTGQLKSTDITYREWRMYSNDSGTSPSTVFRSQRVGGLLEPFAIMRDQLYPPSSGLNKNETFGVIEVPVTSVDEGSVVDLGFVVGSSSYAPGAILSSIGGRSVALKTGMTLNYWSPSSVSPVVTRNLMGDGGSCDNTNLISFLQRQVDRIVLVLNAHVPLKPRSKWNVSHDEPEEEQIDVDFSSFFGVVPSRLAFTDSYTSILKRNQVFSKSLWVSVVEELHAAQERGRGIVSSLDLVTISNPWWGIAGGFKVSVTVVYLGRAAEWESRLSPGIRAVVTPASNPEDMTSLVDHGPFARFPHYRTTAGSLNFARANLLASFMGWVVLQHKDLFMKLLTDS